MAGDAAAAGDGALRGFPPTQLRVRFHELDPYGHVNHGVYLNYFETARIEALDHLGLTLGRLRDRGIHLVVVEVNVRFHAPAVAGDRLTITTELRELRRASSWWHQLLERSGERLAEAAVRTATTDARGRPIPVPADLLDTVTPYLAGAR